MFLVDGIRSFYLHVSRETYTEIPLANSGGVLLHKYFYQLLSIFQRDKQVPYSEKVG